MDRRHATLLLLPVAFLMRDAVAATDPNARVSVDTRVQLQAAMQSHIERSTVAGVFPFVDLRTGQVRKLHPGSAHPMMLRFGEHFVLCTDFRDEAGRAVNIDFYVARNDRRFQVFQVEVANRAPLEALVKSGAARMLE